MDVQSKRERKKKRYVPQREKYSKAGYGQKTQQEK